MGWPAGTAPKWRTATTTTTGLTIQAVHDPTTYEKASRSPTPNSPPSPSTPTTGVANGTTPSTRNQTRCQPLAASALRRCCEHLHAIGDPLQSVLAAVIEGDAGRGACQVPHATGDENLARLAERRLSNRPRNRAGVATHARGPWPSDCRGCDLSNTHRSGGRRRHVRTAAPHPPIAVRLAARSGAMAGAGVRWCRRAGSRFELAHVFGNPCSVAVVDRTRGRPTRRGQAGCAGRSFTSAGADVRSVSFGEAERVHLVVGGAEAEVAVARTPVEGAIGDGRP